MNIWTRLPCGSWTEGSVKGSLGSDTVMVIDSAGRESVVSKHDVCLQLPSEKFEIEDLSRLKSVSITNIFHCLVSRFSSGHLHAVSGPNFVILAPDDLQSMEYAKSRSGVALLFLCSLAKLAYQLMEAQIEDQAIALIGEGSAGRAMAMHGLLRCLRDFTSSGPAAASFDQLEQVS